MKTVKLKCFECKTFFQKEKKEHTRRVKAGCERFFCSLSCTAKTKNTERRFPRITEKRNCLCCGSPMKVTFRLGMKGKEHCSLSCASLNSVTDKRREASRLSGLINGHKSMGNLNSPAQTLKTREAWKYADMKRVLVKNKIPHEFEYEFGNFVFDLALLSRKIFVEFDGKDHIINKHQVIKDKTKTNLASKKGWRVIRIRVLENTVIPVKLLKEALLNKA